MKSILLSLLLLSGCAQYTAFTGIVRTEAALVADKEMDAAIFLLCRGVTIGAWVRRFGESQPSADAWGVLCSSKSNTPPITP